MCTYASHSCMCGDWSTACASPSIVWVPRIKPDSKRAYPLSLSSALSAKACFFPWMLEVQTQGGLRGFRLHSTKPLLPLALRLALNDSVIRFSNSPFFWCQGTEWMTVSVSFLVCETGVCFNKGSWDYKVSMKTRPCVPWEYQERPISRVAQGATGKGRVWSSQSVKRNPFFLEFLLSPPANGSSLHTALTQVFFFFFFCFILRASHVSPQPGDSWIPLLINAVDHCMDRIKELTQRAVELWASSPCSFSPHSRTQASVRFPYLLLSVFTAFGSGAVTGCLLDGKEASVFKKRLLSRF